MSRVRSGRLAALVSMACAVGAISTGAFTAGASAGSSDPDVSIKNFGLNLVKEEVTLPLFRGTSGGKAVTYVITDSSSRDDADARGVAYAPKLLNALGTKAVQRARVVAGRVDFPGTVDFSPERIIVPGPQGFPPAQAQAGAVGDALYSPLITTDGRVVLNATQISNASGVHDAVVAIDNARSRVTLKTFFGFWADKKTVYLHQEATDEVVAAAEGSTLAPNLDAAPGLGSNDRETSARSAILPVVNGTRGVNNPERQGLNSALFGEGDPLNVNQEVPGHGGDRYSPVWDVHPIVWTQAAIDAGLRERLTSNSEIANAFDKGLIVSGGTGPANPDFNGLRAGGFISNCPIVAVL